MKKSISIFMLFSWAMFQAWAAEPKKDVESMIIDYIAKNDPICASCSIMVQKKPTEWLKKHRMLEATTFDILPPPSWNFAEKDGKIFPMDRRNLKEWNNVIISEGMNLDTSEKIIGYVKFFLSSTMSQSEFIDKLLPGEIKQIEEKEKKKIDTEIKVTQTNDKIQIVFYSHDLQGELQQWNAVILKNGEILKLQERSF